MSFLFLFFVVLVFTTRSPVGFTLFLSACPRVPHFPPCRGKFFSQTERRTHWNFWNTAWFFYVLLYLRSQDVCVCVCVLTSPECTRMSLKGARKSSETFSGNIHCICVCLCACVCVCDPEELRQTDGEKVFALQFTAIICPPPLFFHSLSLPLFFLTSTIPLPSHFLSPPSLFLFLKNTSTGMCVHAFFQWYSAEVDSRTSHLSSWLDSSMLQMLHYSQV